MTGALRAMNSPANIATVGPIASGSLSMVGDALSLQLNLQKADTVHVAPGPGQSLVIMVGPVKSAAVPAAAIPTPSSSDLTDAGSGRAIVRLKYADLSEVVGLLVSGSSVAPNDVFTPQTSAGNFSGSSTLGSSSGGTLSAFGGGGPAGPVVSYGGTQASVGQRVDEHIAVDRRLNAIILTGSPDYIAKTRDFIEELDIPVASIMLDTEIVELDNTAAKDLGIDPTNGSGVIASSTLAAKTLTTTQSQLSLQATVYDEVTAGKGQIIAQPRILALDGRTASIVTGDALPIVTSIAVSGVNAVQQQVQYVNVGVNLQILPRITADGYVTTQVYSAVSSVTGYSQSYPEISQREATTAAIVKDGEPFVIGGLIQKNEIDSIMRIPGLSDIPLLGALFRIRHYSSSTTNLYIIMTPHILKPDQPNPPTAAQRKASQHE